MFADIYQHCWYIDVAYNKKAGMNRLKNWHIFSFIFILLVASQLIVDKFLADLLIAGIFVFVSTYFLFIGDTLRQLAKEKTNWYFVFNFFYLLLFYVLLILDFQLGNGAIVIGLSVYFVFSYIYVADELAVALRKAEGKNTSDFKQQAEFLFFFLWPVGIWFLQPRINKLTVERIK
ncbi:hypothetical protein C9994_03505 [Marivirga lumbricoides]|uniref:Uncharacterized protein n=1 Tax=Marivirga lumbricoides TaxID=1046115 RepID=A0A2T4DU01_9BACT|nr:hypothetical protein C9994_03505 [Marivirga lumbricoides]